MTVQLPHIKYSPSNIRIKATFHSVFMSVTTHSEEKLVYNYTDLMTIPWRAPKQPTVYVKTIKTIHGDNSGYRQAPWFPSSSLPARSSNKMVMVRFVSPSLRSAFPLPYHSQHSSNIPLCHPKLRLVQALVSTHTHIYPYTYRSLLHY